MPRRTFLTMLLVILGLSATLFTYGAASRITRIHQLDYGEGIVMWQAAHVTTPKEAYHPISEYPFIVFHYPPVYHLVSLAAGKISGELLFAGRFVSFAATLILMVALGLLVYRGVQGTVDGTAAWSGAAVAALLPASLATVRFWVPVMRVDMLGLLLSVLGVVAFLESRSRARFRLLAAVCFVLAMFTKQTLISAPLACIVLLAMRGQLRDAISFAALVAALGAVPLGAWQYLTDGQFVRHLFLYNQNVFSLRDAVTMVGMNLSGMWPVVCAAIVPLVMVRRRGRQTGVDSPGLWPHGDAGKLTTIVRCLGLYVAFAFLISWTSGKFGAAPNYFIEWNLMACALAGITVSLLISGRRQIDWSWRQMAPAALAIGVAVWLLGSGLNGALRFTEGARRLDAAHAQLARDMDQLLRATPGKVFSYDMTILMLAGKEIPLEPAIMFDLARTNMWDPTPFVEQLQRRHYALVITNSDLPPDDGFMPDVVRQAVTSAYGPPERVGEYRVYRPLSH